MILQAWARCPVAKKKSIKQRPQGRVLTLRGSDDTREGGEEKKRVRGWMKVMARDDARNAGHRRALL